MRSKKKEKLETLQKKVDTKVAEMLAISGEMLTSESDKEFEELQKKVIRVASKMDRDAKLVRLSENPKKVLN